MTSNVMPKLARHLLPAAALGAALLTFGNRAHAQDTASADRFGQKGQFAVTAEDLMGVYSDRASYKDNNGFTHAVNNTRVSLLFSTHGGGQYMVTTPASTIGFHYFVIDHLSIGGNLGYESRDGSVEEPAGPVVVTQNLGTGSTFIFQPKVGYSLMFNNTLGFWFRGGPSVAVDTEYPEAGNSALKNQYTFWMLSADALFTIMPVDHLGFYVGPGLDISFTGTLDTNDTVRGVPVSVSYDAAYRRFKLGAGMIAYF